MRGFSLLELTVVLVMLAAAMSLFKWPSPHGKQVSDDVFIEECVTSVYSIQRAHQQHLIFSESKEWPCDDVAN